MNRNCWKSLTACILAAAGMLLNAQQVPGMQTLLDYNTGKPVRYAGELSSAPVLVPRQYLAKRNEFRGVWVATIENIDFSKHTVIKEFQKDYQSMIKNLRTAGFTAIIFQVRPSNDAFYASKLNPWSKYLGGAEGMGLRGFDPLRYMVREAHRNGLEFHAWLNPYRVANPTAMSKRTYLSTLSPENFAVKNPGMVLSIPSSGKNLLILNPGEPAVMRFLLATAEEIYTGYDVDGIHLDDYFYPYESMVNTDYATYRRYAQPGMGIDDWRRKNVDTLISNLSANIRKYNRANRKHVRLGISPFGIWANRTTTATKGGEQSHAAGSLTHGSQSYFKQHADTRRWIKDGWIDYIAPQLYWSFSHNTAAYAALADWWADTVRGSNTALYIGHSAARLGVNPDWKNPDELANQLKYNCRRPEIKGSIFFSYRRMFEPSNKTQQEGTRRVVEGLWKKKLPR